MPGDPNRQLCKNIQRGRASPMVSIVDVRNWRRSPILITVMDNGNKLRIDYCMHSLFMVRGEVKMTALIMSILVDKGECSIWQVAYWYNQHSPISIDALEPQLSLLVRDGVVACDHRGLYRATSMWV
jgi:hypothetical protein